MVVDSGGDHTAAVSKVRSAEEVGKHRTMSKNDLMFSKSNGTNINFDVVVRFSLRLFLGVTSVFSTPTEILVYNVGFLEPSNNVGNSKPHLNYIANQLSVFVM